MDHRLIGTGSVLCFTGALWYQHVYHAKIDANDRHRSNAGQDYAMDAGRLLGILPVVPKRIGIVLGCQ